VRLDAVSTDLTSLPAFTNHTLRDYSFPFPPVGSSIFQTRGRPVCLPPFAVEPDDVHRGHIPAAVSGRQVAEIFVDRFVYSDWETIWVQNRCKDAWPIFRFTAVEAAKALKGVWRGWEW
jgi:hypothetical protein